MPIYVYPSANNPKLVKKLWIFFQGSWRSITSASVYSGGLWRKLYTSEFDPISVDGGTDVDLREKWRARYPNDTPAGRITITLTSNCIASSTGAYALKTGRWPSDVELIVNINSGVVVAGRGGNGGACSSCSGGNGGPALLIEHPTTFYNGGTIGGGGGYGAGGGGRCIGASGGDLINGGSGGYCCLTANCGRTIIRAGDGGSLGGSGGGGICNASCRTSGGGPGCAVVSQGYSYSLGGDVRGPRC